MYSESDLMPISALQHFVFCPRQCALIHIERLWAENRLTAEGMMLHEKVHSETKETRESVRIEYGMPIRSLNLGLIGKTDVVEFHNTLNNSKKLQPYPIEYKRGRPKDSDCDVVQLCAQALCLEENLETNVPEGALFYGKTKRRLSVKFDDILRKKTIEATQMLHELIIIGKTPPPVWSKKCDHCSLQEICLPKGLSSHRSVQQYLWQSLEEG